MRVTLLVMVCACLGACTDEPDVFRCEPLVAIPECPGCGTGEVRAGLATERDYDLIVAAPDGGLLWRACESIIEYDGTLAVRHDFGPEPADAHVTELVYGGPEQIYVRHYETGPPSQMRLKAFGRVTWSVDNGFFHTIVRPEALYSGGVGYLAALSRDDGRLLWERGDLGDSSTAMAVSRDGVVLADTETASELGPDGELNWSRAIAAEPIGDVRVAATSTGILIAAWFEGDMLDLGDRTLQGLPSGRTTFVAELEPAGGTRWAHVIGSGLSLRITSIGIIGDKAVVSGHYVNDVPQLGLPLATDADAFLAFVDATGAVGRAYHGPGNQNIESVMPGLDGTVWMHLTNEFTATDEPIEVTVGSQTFAQSQLVLSLVP